MLVNMLKKFVICHPSRIISHLCKYAVTWECCTHDYFSFLKDRYLLVSLTTKNSAMRSQKLLSVACG